LAVERVDDAGAPAGDTSGVDLVSETKTSVVSPQHANPKRTDDASTLAKDLLGVSLVPEITVQSVPDATPSTSVDQEVPSVFHPMPFRFSFDPPSDPASVDAFIKAYPNLPGYHMWLLGRRRRRHPSLEAFAVVAGPTETRQQARTPFAPFDIGRRPTTRSSHRAASSSMEAHL
jgi:hypothetical protein